MTISASRKNGGIVTARAGEPTRHGKRESVNIFKRLDSPGNTWLWWCQRATNKVGSFLGRQVRRRGNPLTYYKTTHI